MRIKIVSDGTPTGTKVVDAETGEMVHGVTAASIKIGVGDVSRVTIELVKVPVEVIGEAIARSVLDG